MGEPSAAEIARAIRTGEHWRLRDQEEAESDFEQPLTLSGGLDPYGTERDGFEAAEFVRKYVGSR